MAVFSGASTNESAQQRSPYKSFFRKSFALMFQNPKLSRILIFVAILPLSMLQAAYLRSLQDFTAKSFEFFSSEAPDPEDVKPQVNPLISLLMILLGMVSICLELSVLSHVYLKEDQKPVKELFNFPPRALLNLVILKLWGVLFVVVFGLVIFGSYYLTGSIYFTVIILFASLVFLLTYYTLVFGVATTVSILEPDSCGLKALKRAAFLVRGNEMLGVLFYLLISAPGVILLLLPHPNNLAINVLLWTLSWFCMSFTSLFSASGNVVFFYLCKESRDEEEPLGKNTTDLEAAKLIK